MGRLCGDSMTRRSSPLQGLAGLFVVLLVLFLIQSALLTNYFVYGYGLRSAAILEGVFSGTFQTLQSEGMASVSAATPVTGSILDPTTCRRRSVFLFLPATALATAVVGIKKPRDYFTQILIGATGVIGLLTILTLFGAPSAMGRFLLYLEGIGVCIVAVALYDYRDRVTKRHLLFVLVFTGVLVGLQFTSGDAAPDYGDCTQRYLTAPEMDAKEWGGERIQGTVVTNFFFSDVKLYPIGNHEPGLNNLLANKSIGTAINENKYIAHRSSSRLYVVQGKYRVRFTYDVDEELGAESDNVYSNGHVNYYHNGSNGVKS